MKSVSRKIANQLKSQGKRNLSLSLFCAITVTVMPQGASAYVPKIVHAEDKATSIDGEVYENSEIVSCRTPVRYYYYKVIEEDAVDNKDYRALAEKWGDESLPSPDTIRGLVKKVKVANDEVAKDIQQAFCEMLKDGRDDIIAVYAEALRLNGELKGLAAAVGCYKKCLSSPKWKRLAEREPRKRKEAFTAIKKLVASPSGMSIRTAGREIEYDYYYRDWTGGELQQKIDECYYELIDLKKAKIVADNQRMDASSPNAQDLRKMRAMTAQTKKNVRVTKRMAKKAEDAADAAAGSADSAAAFASSAAGSASSAAGSAASAAGSAASAADSAARAARSADEARFGF